MLHMNPLLTKWVPPGLGSFRIRMSVALLRLACATMQRTDRNTIAVCDVHWSLNSGEYSLSFREIYNLTREREKKKAKDRESFIYRQQQHGFSWF